MKILVTGATGFVGNVLLRRLRESHPDFSISAFVLPDDPLKNSLSRYEGLRLIEGDITHRKDVLEAVQGHSHIIHLAGFISYWKRDRKKLMEVNIQGVENIVEACLEHRIRKLVHISSVGACGFHKDGRLATEDSPFNWPDNFSYMVSKHEGQKIVEKACKEKGLEGVILLPASIMGPGDRDLNTPHNQLYDRIYQKKLFGCFSGGLAVVDVRDLVEIIIKALDAPRGGEKYLIVGANVEYSDVVKRIGKHANRKTYPFAIPAFLLRMTGGFLEFVSFFTRRKPLLTSAYGKLSDWKVFYSNEKSKKAFAHEYRPFEKTIEDSCRYFEKTFLS
jgi:dihydroflavonol-4-reductase